MKKCLLFTMLLLMAATLQAQTRSNTEVYTLEIKYLYAIDSTVAAPEYVGEFEEGATYSIESPLIVGYHPDQDTVYGKMFACDMIDTVFYMVDTYQVVTNSDPEEGGMTRGDGTYNFNETVTVSAIPNDGYFFQNWTQHGEEVSQRLDYSFTVTEDITLTAHFVAIELPAIFEDIETPAPICAGDVLDLVVPAFDNADGYAWQMSDEVSFEDAIAYGGQALDGSYNGWKLRFMAYNTMDTVYSNVVIITVKDMSGLVLSGDFSSCTELICDYSVAYTDGATLTWMVTDHKAVIEPMDSVLRVVWGTKGIQQVLVQAEDLVSGCTTELSMDVAVQSYIEDGDVHDIVAKKHNNKPYLLIYPNPKDAYKYQWYKNGEIINGAKGQYYYPSEGLTEGDYQVYISFNADAHGNLFCGAFSAVYTVYGSRDSFSVYPNPAHANQSLVVVNEGGDGELMIYTLDGRLVWQQLLSNGHNTVDVVLPQGIYMLRFNDNETVKTERMIIQ